MSWRRWWHVPSIFCKASIDLFNWKTLIRRSRKTSVKFLGLKFMPIEIRKLCRRIVSVSNIISETYDILTLRSRLLRKLNIRFALFLRLGNLIGNCSIGDGERSRWINWRSSVTADTVDGISGVRALEGDSGPCSRLNIDICPLDATRLLLVVICHLCPEKDFWSRIEKRRNWRY